MQDLHAADQDEDPMNKLKGQKIVSCRICKGDHWTTRCPYKDTLGPMQKELAEQLGLSTGEKEKAAGKASSSLSDLGRLSDYSPSFPLLLPCGLVMQGSTSFRLVVKVVVNISQKAQFKGHPLISNRDVEWGKALQKLFCLGDSGET